jgi:hypothetical protein
MNFKIDFTKYIVNDHRANLGGAWSYVRANLCLCKLHGHVLGSRSSLFLNFMCLNLTGIDRCDYTRYIVVLVLLSFAIAL